MLTNTNQRKELHRSKSESERKKTGKRFREGIRKELRFQGIGEKSLEKKDLRGEGRRGGEATKQAREKIGKSQGTIRMKESWHDPRREDVSDAGQKGRAEKKDSLGRLSKQIVRVSLREKRIPLAKTETLKEGSGRKEAPRTKRYPLGGVEGWELEMNSFRLKATVLAGGKKIRIN